MAANHANNYSYKNCPLCFINYFETSSTAINTPKYKFLILVWLFTDDDIVNDEMII